MTPRALSPRALTPRALTPRAPASHALALVFALGLGTAALAEEPIGLTAIAPAKAPAERDLDSLSSALGSKLLDARQLKATEKACVTMNINCGQTVTSTLDNTDCELDDGTRVDFWVFDGTSGTQVTIDLSSDDFDAFLALLDPVPEVAAQDDDSGPGSDARIVFTLDQTGEWAIGANNFTPTSGNPGDYALKLACSGTAPQAPAAPSNLTANPISSTAIDIFWNDNSNNEDDFQVQMRMGSGDFATIGTVAANSIGANVTGLDPATEYGFRVRARNETGNSAFSNIATATTPGGGGTSPCVPSDTVLCLQGRRFQLTVDWKKNNGETGKGHVLPGQSTDSAILWFFGEDNWEMLIKVLDACAIDPHYWVFFAATTNVEFTLRVTDTDTGQVKTYRNPQGQAANAVTDTSTFATCP